MRRIYAEVVGFASAYDRGRTGAGLGPGDPRGLAASRHRPDRHRPRQRLRPGHGRVSTLGRLAGWPRCSARTPLRCSPRRATSAASVPAGGLVELAASVLALQHGTCRRRSTTTTPTRPARWPCIREPRPVTKPYVLKVSLTDLGPVCRRGRAEVGRVTRAREPPRSARCHEIAP